MNCITLEFNFYISIEFIISLSKIERNQNKHEIDDLNFKFSWLHKNQKRLNSIFIHFNI